MDKKFVRIPSRIGGKSLTNGVALRSGSRVVVAVRNAGGTVETYEYNKKKFNVRLPFISECLGFLSDVTDNFRISAKYSHNRFAIFKLLKYHGAEHKVIHCYEDGDALTLSNVKSKEKYHSRCGSTAVANIIVIEGILHTLIPIKSSLTEIILFAAASGIGIEAAKYSDRNKNKVSSVLSFPGKVLQKVTVLEPDDDMIECAIEAANSIIVNEREI